MNTEDIDRREDMRAEIERLRKELERFRQFLEDAIPNTRDREFRRLARAMLDPPVPCYAVIGRIGSLNVVRVKSITDKRLIWETDLRTRWISRALVQGLFPNLDQALDARIRARAAASDAAEEGMSLIAAKEAMKTSPGYQPGFNSSP